MRPSPLATLTDPIRALLDRAVSPLSPPDLPISTADAPLPVPVPESVELGTAIDTLDRVHATTQPGEALRTARQAALDLRGDLQGSGMPDHVSSHDLVTLPYPTRFGLWRAPVSPSPFLFITNRLVVVRWTESDGTRRTLLFEPSDVELDANTPYFAALRAAAPAGIADRLATEHGTVVDRVRELGIDPDEVDYVAFDHLHTQDVRRLIGTTKPQDDLPDDAPGDGWFPNARLVVQRTELEAMRDLHPLQRPWYQPETYVDLDPERLLPIDGDRLLGPGVAIVRTPGHATGNQTLLLHTSSGIWALSENVVATECLTPEHSRIPGVAGWTRRWSQEVVLNANTLETTAAQYNSCVLEKTVVDRVDARPDFLQFFPTSELTASPLSPGTAPTFVHGELRHE